MAQATVNVNTPDGMEDFKDVPITLDGEVRILQEYLSRRTGKDQNLLSLHRTFKKDGVSRLVLAKTFADEGVESGATLRMTLNTTKTEQAKARLQKGVTQTACSLTSAASEAGLAVIDAVEDQGDRMMDKFSGLEEMVKPRLAKETGEGERLLQVQETCTSARMDEILEELGLPASKLKWKPKALHLLNSVAWEELEPMLAQPASVPAKRRRTDEAGNATEGGAGYRV